MADLWYSIAKDNPPLPISRPFRFFLTDLGTGLGNNNLIGNYTVSTEFHYQATHRYEIHSFIATISDNANFAQTDYGGISGGLINGLSFWYRAVNGTELRLFTPDAIKQNYDWFSITEHAELTTFSGPSQTLVLDFRVSESFGVPLTIFPGERIILRLQDNFTGLTRHTFQLRGTRY